MKRTSGIFSFALLTSFSLLTSCNNGSFSGSNFEGVVSYEIKLDGGSTGAMSGMTNTVSMKTFVKGDRVRGEENMAGYNTVVIGSSKTPDVNTMLVTMFGHKYAIAITDSSAKNPNESPKIEYIDSANTTKEIAGYSCKKAKITINVPNGSPIISYVYYTTDLPYADPQGLFKGLKGMPMEFSGNMEHGTITITAKSVDKKSLPDSLFTVPADYKQVTMADMEKDVMQNMGHDTTAGPGADTARQ